MAPKHHHHEVSDDRKSEIRGLMEEAGYDVERFSKTEAAWIDLALKKGWEIPPPSEMTAVRNKDPADKRHNLRTYAIHSAREAIGQPVGGGKNEA